MNLALLIWAIVATLLALPMVAALALLAADELGQWRYRVNLKRENLCGTPWCTRGYEHDGECRRMQP